ncbi:hypothetical protein [Nibricoccus sp. IMCC34717]|uniref:hypothetical protein n=1 Tax=Nibricoccus sp. IMCC34717 TaxID=3034021 RepID=UPI00384AD202
MAVTALFLFVVVTVFLLWARKLPLTGRTTSVVCGVAVLAAGTWVAWPFLNDTGVGTGEAHNYAQGLKDAIQQLRLGRVPLVGEGPFAFNGRIHPLRSAPYLFALGGAIDALTLRQLNAWQVQNLSLALGLVAVPWVVFTGLRRWSRVSDRVAAAVAMAAAVSPAILGLVTFNLFMTVHALPWVALAAVAVAGSAQRENPRLDWVLWTALAVAWWAHPPLALWACAVLLPVRVVQLALSPRLMRFGNFVLAGCFGALCAAFVFVSVMTSQGESLSAGPSRERNIAYGSEVYASLQRMPLASHLQVTRGAGDLSDIQIGLPSALAALAAIVLVARRLEVSLVRCVTAALLAGATIGYVAVCLPLGPWVEGFWRLMPWQVAAMTNMWPGQRLVPLASVLGLLALATIAPRAHEPWRPDRRLRIFLALLGVWAAYQALPFISRGMNDRWPEDRDQRLRTAQNTLLTPIAYNGLSGRPRHAYYAMPVWSTLQVTNPDGTVAVDNLVAAEQLGKRVQTIESKVTEAAYRMVKLDTALTLQAGRSYLVRLDWHVPFFDGIFFARGERLEQVRKSERVTPPDWMPDLGALPTVMVFEPVNKPVETVQFFIVSDELLPQVTVGQHLVTMTVYEVDPAVLPVRLEGLHPLKATVRDAKPGQSLSTPRVFIDGYAARVNGASVGVSRGVHGEVRVPLSEGISRIELDYPGPHGLRGALIISLTALAVAALSAGIRLVSGDGNAWRTARWLAPGFTGALLFSLALSRTQRLPETRTLPPGHGPLLIEFKVNSATLNRGQMMLTGGIVGAANFVFLQHRPDGTAEVGVETWGREPARGTAPLRTSGINQLVVDSGIFNTPSAPGTFVGPLNNSAVVELNGREVVRDTGYVFPAEYSSIQLGRSLVGGSHAEPDFRGEIVSVKRIPFAPTVALAQGHPPLWCSLEVTGEPVSPGPLVELSPQGGVFLLEHDGETRARLLWREATGRHCESAWFPLRRRELQTLRLSAAENHWELSLPAKNVTLASPAGTRNAGATVQALVGRQHTTSDAVRLLWAEVKLLNQPRNDAQGQSRGNAKKD